MRVLVCGLGLLLTQACARQDVPLGTEGNTGSGDNNSTTSGGTHDANTTGSQPTGGSMNTGNGGLADANTGGGSDASGSGGTTCAPATCDMPTADLGTIDASAPDSTLMHSGHGSAFLSLVGTDKSNSGGLMGPYVSDGIIGIKAVLAAPAGSTYEVHIVGDLGSGSDGCKANTSTASGGQTTAIWNGMGPVMTAADKKLSIEVRHVAGPCDKDWTLTVTGLPCTGLTVPGASCP